MNMIPSLWCMDALALDGWLGQTSERMRLGSALFLDFDPEQVRPYELLDGGIAVIPIQGVLAKTRPWWSSMTSYAALADHVRHALGDASVRAILFDIDSPGGEAAGAQELASVIASADAVKPVYAWADGLCCSAAYWLASTARTVAASPTTTVGSIGVIGVHMEVSKAAERIGYAFTVISSGHEKAYGNQFEPLSPEARASIQANFDGLYALFLADVATRRGLDATKSGPWADGRTFLAGAAAAAGLIDLIVNKDAFISHIREELMDRQTLQTQHPQLYQAVFEEGRQAAAAEAAPNLEAARTEAARAARQEVTDLAGAIAGPEIKAKLSEALAAGLTGEALARAAEIMGVSPGAAGAESAPGNHAHAMLKALKGLDPSGVSPAAPGKQVEKPNTNALADYVKAHSGG